MNNDSGGGGGGGGTDQKRETYGASRTAWASASLSAPKREILVTDAQQGGGKGITNLFQGGEGRERARTTGEEVEEGVVVRTLSAQGAEVIEGGGNLSEQMGGGGMGRGWLGLWWGI